MLVIATPQSLHAIQMVEIARALNPAIRIAIRTQSREEAERLQRNTGAELFLADEELARGMILHVETQMTLPPAAVPTPLPATGA